MTAIIKGQKGFTIAIARRRKHWQVGINSFDKPTSLGDVNRTDAKQRRRTLEV